MAIRKLSIHIEEQGRGKPDVKRFKTLREASLYVQSQWQGADYVDGHDGFHTDYCTFELIGFTLKDIGHFYFTDDDCREFTFTPFDDSPFPGKPANPYPVEFHDGADRGL